MKASEIIKDAVLLCESNDVTEYSDFNLPFLNIILSRIYKYNNINRRSKGLPILGRDMILVKSADDDVPCEEEFYTAVKYGLASHLLIGSGETDDGRSVTFSNLFADEVTANTDVIEKQIEDVYL